MLRQNLTGLMASLVIGFGVSATGSDCRRFVVIAPDGYANIRSSAGVQRDNLLAAVPVGMEVEPATDGAPRRGAWLRISAPIPGWVHRRQVAGLDCATTPRIAPDAGLEAIGRLAHRARTGDAQSAASYFALSRVLDGALAEAYAEQIAAWATADPAGLAAVLKRQRPEVRASTLKLLDFGLGNQTSDARARFETVFGGPLGESMH